MPRSYVSAKRMTSQGYVHQIIKGHPRASAKGYVSEHVSVAEAVLGHPLPLGAVVHHVNENKADNRKANLVICESHSYHALLHRRADALRACGHADWRKCRICHVYDDPANLYMSKTGNSINHRKCLNEYAKKWRKG